MLSAGNTSPAPTPGATASTANNQQPGIAFGPTFVTPPVIPNTGVVGGSTTNISVQLKDLPKGYWWGHFGMQALGVAAGITNQVLNYNLAVKSMSVQGDMARWYYQTQDKIAGYQKTVALRGLDVQNNAINAQQAMHSAQMRHEETMLRLEGAAGARIAQIQENGKSDRLNKALALNATFGISDPFATNRSSWPNYGTTV